MLIRYATPRGALYAEAHRLDSAIASAGAKRYGVGLRQFHRQIDDSAALNPLSDNQIANRDDAAKAVRALCEPLLPFLSPHKGRVRLGSSGAHFHVAAADLEGLARPIWGLAPLAAGGGAFDHWTLLRMGLAAGSDPDSADYWGPAAANDQRIVESAAIGLALALAPEVFWDGLPGAGRDNLSRWLIGALEAEPPPNNWMFFRVIVSLGLDRVGVAFDRDRVERSLRALEALDIGNGWYRDGAERRADHYIPFAMHFYGLVYAALAEGDHDRRERFRQRAATFAAQFRHWFADDGAALPFGRSLTYRFAHSSFWGAAAFAGVEGVQWGEARGLWARNLRWWSRQSICDRDQVLPVGYAYPNLLMSEAYNSPGSPYWAMKAFLPLALPDEHPFWMATETASDRVTEPVTQKEPGIVLWSEPGQVTAIAGGQEARKVRHGAEKYCKFAYSTRYGFSVESHPRCFDTGAFDNTLAFSDDGRHFRVRDGEREARIGDGLLYSRWSPMENVEVETWLIAAPPWHIRVHSIQTKIPVAVAEGGFAVRRTDLAPRLSSGVLGCAVVETDDDVSAMFDLDGPKRMGRIQQADPNTNIINPRTWVPQLRADLSAGGVTLVSAVMAQPNCDTARELLASPPAAPNIDELCSRRDTMSLVPVWDLPASLG
jgi:hypothetical protein